MTGYLARLAARAQGALPAAGSRPRSIFEGEAAPSGLPDEVAEAGDERVPQPAAPRDAVFAEPGQASAGREALPLQARRAAPRSTTIEAGGRPADPSRDAGEQHPSLVSPSAERAAAAVPATSRPATPDRREVAEVALSGALGAPAEAPREPVPARPQATERSQPEPASAAPEPAVVHVSIGRVEVRTSMVNPAPPAPAARAAAPDQVLSLHDYLRGERAR